MNKERREKLQHDILLMYDAASDSIGNKTHSGVIEIGSLRHALTGNDVYSVDEFDTEIEYLISAGYFRRYALRFLILEPKGIDKLLGSTSFSTEKMPEIKIPWNKTWWGDVVINIIAALIVGFILYLMAFN